MEQTGVDIDVDVATLSFAGYINAFRTSEKLVIYLFSLVPVGLISFDSAFLFTKVMLKNNIPVHRGLILNTAFVSFTAYLFAFVLDFIENTPVGASALGFHWMSVRLQVAICLVGQTIGVAVNFAGWWVMLKLYQRYERFQGEKMYKRLFGWSKEETRLVGPLVRSRSCLRGLWRRESLRKLTVMLYFNQCAPDKCAPHLTVFLQRIQPAIKFFYDCTTVSTALSKNNGVPMATDTDSVCTCYTIINPTPPKPERSSLLDRIPRDVELTLFALVASLLLGWSFARCTNSIMKAFNYASPISKRGLEVVCLAISVVILAPQVMAWLVYGEVVLWTLMFHIIIGGLYLFILFAIFLLRELDNAVIREPSDNDDDDDDSDDDDDEDEKWRTFLRRLQTEPSARPTLRRVDSGVF